MLKRKPLLFFLLLIIPLGVWAANVFIVDDSGNLTASGSVTLTAQEINGDVTLANDETIDNAVDSAVRITFNNDSQTLGQFRLTSDNAAGNMAVADMVQILFRARDAGGSFVDYSGIYFKTTDVTDGAADGEIQFRALQNGTSLFVLSVDNNGVTFPHSEELNNNTDGELEVVFNDDAVELGSFLLRSSVTGTENENYTELAYVMEDGGSDEHTFAAVRGYIDDRSNGAEDGSVRIRVAVGGTETLIETIDEAGSTVVGTVDANAFTVNAGAGLDNQSAGALLLGAVTATSVEIGDAGVPTDVQGKLTILGTTGVGLDTAGATAMFIAEATATSLELGASDITTDVNGPLTILGTTGNGIDTAGATAMYVGEATATSLFLGASDILTTVSGPLGYGVNVSLDTAATVTCTANATASTGVYGNHHYNNDADVIKYILPAVVAGMSVTIGNTDVAASTVITIEIDGSDKIVLNGTLLDAGDTIDSPASAGASITLIGIDGVRWNTINRTGTWIDGGAT
jgi:hypothetical protein